MIGRKKGIATEKLQGGKLVRIKAEFQDNSIISIQITGDFFIYPEENVKELEEVFVLKNIFFDEKEIENEILKIVKKKGMTLIGITPEAITRLVKKAIVTPIPEEKKKISNEEKKKTSNKEKSDDAK